MVEAVDGALLAAVADGLGGHPAGDLASRIAIEGLADYARRQAATLREAPPRALQDIAQAIDAAMLDVGRQNPALSGMATTLATLYFAEERVFRLNVGDSLIFRAPHGRACTLWNELHEGGDGFLTSCLGGNLRRIDCPVRGTAVKRGDRFLIASDGVEVLDARAIGKLLKTADSPQAAVQQLLDAVDREEFRYQDNTTAVAVFAE